MKKKWLILGMAAFMALGLAACKGIDDNGGNNTDNPSQEETTSYTVTFKQAGFDDVVKTVNAGEALTDVPVPQEKVGYTVVWNTQDFSAVTQDLTVEAVATANTYKITYDAGEGTVTPAEQDVVFDSVPTLATPTREEYTFTGWTYQGKAFFGKWTIAENATLVATWVKNVPDTYTVTFRQNGQLDKVFEGIIKGDDFTQIPDPMAKKGHTVEWDRHDLAALTNVTDNIVVEAVETLKTYTVKLDTDGGTLAQTTLTITYGEEYKLPEATKKEYMFQYWTYEGDAVAQQGFWDIDVDGTEIKLVAKWKLEWSDNF